MEIKATLNRIKIRNNRSFLLENVIECIIQNYCAANSVNIVLSDISTAIPQATTVEGTAVPSLPYVINAQGNVIKQLKFDIQIPAGAGYVIVDYTTKVKGQ